MKKHILFILVLCIPLFANCQNHRGKSNTPKWAHKLPKSNSKIFAVGKGSSGSADIAYRKAVLDANTMLAKKVAPVVTSKTSRIISTVENGKTVEKRVDVIRQKVTTSLEGVEEVNKSQTREGELYLVYVLVSIPNQAISRSIVNEINSDSTLLAKLSNTKMYNDLLSEANR
ncbi:MAG: LPP20 family lipoprotein [Bacteroidales bacterium]|nr:LPP20 family lipoprotein [Bacteroidales bacterium]MDD3890907.1 LPP20 family lipoprotein [Bacteroidales bacterium]